MQNSDSHQPIPGAVDVAFSLLATDEPVAEALVQRISDKVRAFVWSDRQKDMAGKDGVALLTELYEKRSQLVVVLYRSGYGETKWTKVEESAITSKAVNDGWSHILLISLDGTKPSWLPGSRLWYGYDQFGPDIAAETIVARFSELGVAPQPETLIDKAGRIEREKQGAGRAENWRRGVEGITAVLAEIETLWKYLEQRAKDINESAPSFGVQYRVARNGVRQLAVHRASVTFGWYHHYANSLTDATLLIREFATRLSTKQFIDNDEPIEEPRYIPFLDWKNERVVWRERARLGSVETVGASFTTDQLADRFIERLLQRHGGVSVD
jgi:hypothetical protein